MLELSFYNDRLMGDRILNKIAQCKEALDALR